MGRGLGCCLLMGGLAWRVWWRWRRLHQGAGGARAQALGLCLQVTVRAGFLASSGQSLRPALRVPCWPLLPPTLAHLLPRGSRLAPQPSLHVPSPHSLTPSLGTRPPPGPRPHPVSPFCSIRQYELVVHTDIDAAKVYVGEMGRLKSYENQKP